MLTVGGQINVWGHAAREKSKARNAITIFENELSNLKSRYKKKLLC